VVWPLVTRHHAHSAKTSREEIIENLNAPLGVGACDAGREVGPHMARTPQLLPRANFVTGQQARKDFFAHGAK